MLFVVAKNEKGTITLSSANGFVYNNRGGWETYFWRKYVPEGDWMVQLQIVHIHQ